MIGIPIGVRSTKLQNIYEIAHSYNLFIAQTHILIFMKDMRAYFPRCVHVKSSGREYRGNKRPTDAEENGVKENRTLTFLTFLHFWRGVHGL